MFREIYSSSGSRLYHLYHMIHCFKEQKRKYLAFQSSLPKKYRNLPRESLRYHGNFRETIKTHMNIGNEIEKLLANLRIAFSFFYKQLMSGFSPESCWYFQGFRSSKLLNGCLVVGQVTYVYEECNNLQDPKLIFMIAGFKIFPIMFLGQLNFGGLSV